MIKRFFSHTVLYGFAPQLTKLLGILTLPVLTSYLTALDYAVFGLVITYSTMFSAIQTLGLNIVIGNTFYKYNSNDRYKVIWRQLLGFLQLYSIGYGIILSILFYFLTPEEAECNRIAIILTNVLPTVLFTPTQIFVFRFYQKQELPIPLAIRSILLGVVTIVFNLLFIAWFKLGYMGWFYASAISSTVGFLFFFYPFFIKYRFLPIFRFKWKTIFKYLKISLPTVPHYYSVYLLKSSDRAVMDILKVPTASIGLYSFANSFTNYFDSISVAFANSSGPMYLKSYRFDNAKVADLNARNLTYLMQVIFLCGTFLFSIWSKEIFYVLIKNIELREVYPMAIILIMAYNHRPMYFAVFTKISYHEKTGNLWKMSFFAGVISIGLNLALIPFMGYTASVYVSFTAMMYMGYIGFFLKEFRSINSINYYPLLWLGLTVLLTVIAYFAVEFRISVKVLITTGLCSIIGYLFYVRKSVILR